MQPRIDHLILLVPSSVLHNLPSDVTSNFTVSPGGKHADNKTENKLIIFADGSYIELISFIEDNPFLKEGHWWGNLENGLIDWALTTEDVKDVDQIRTNLDQASIELSPFHTSENQTQAQSVSYASARAGSRIRPDGEILKWFVTFAQGTRVRAELPFWCHDETNRVLRVPCNDVKATNHPCGAVGVGEILINVPAHEREKFETLYDILLGKENREHNQIGHGKVGSWKVSPAIPWKSDVDPNAQSNIKRPVISLFEADRNDRFDGKAGSFVKIELLTNSSGEGKPREELSWDVGGRTVEIGFAHGVVPKEYFLGEM